MREARDREMPLRGDMRRDRDMYPFDRDRGGGGGDRRGGRRRDQPKVIHIEQVYTCMEEYVYSGTSDKGHSE